MKNNTGIVIALSVLAAAMMILCAYAPVADADDDNEELSVINITGESKTGTYGKNCYWDAEKKEFTLRNEPLSNIEFYNLDNVKVIVNEDVTFSNKIYYPAIYFNKYYENQPNDIISSVTIEGSGSINADEYGAIIDASGYNLTLKGVTITGKDFPVFGIEGYSINIIDATIKISSKNYTGGYILAMKGIFCEGLSADQIICYNKNGDIIPWTNDGSVVKIEPKEPGGEIVINGKTVSDPIAMKIVVILAAIIAIVCFGYVLLGKGKETT